MPEISQATSKEQIAAIQELIREYTTWAFTLIEGSDQAPTFKDLETELATLPGVYAPPTGRLLLATHNGQPAGCICLKAHNAETSELKRLYVRPSFRGHNLGQQLVNTLVAEAQQIGYKRIILDSHITMKKAHTLYQNAGFKFVNPPANFPEELIPIVVFMECDLVTPSR